MDVKRICVFCGSSMGARPLYREVAMELGAELARRGIGVVYGGGNIGLMSAVADGALAEGGEVIGVIPEPMIARELAHQRVTTLHVVATMHERKALMADLSGAFLALPGGFGTYDEFCEVLTWSQLGIHKKPCALLNLEGFYDPLLTMFDRAVEEGFVRRENRSLVLDGATVSEVLERIREYHPPESSFWITRESR